VTNCHKNVYLAVKLGFEARKGKDMSVSVIKKRTIESGMDFFRKLFNALRGPTNLMTLLKVDSILREKVLLTLSISNNCYT